jgi:hypothetical protein
MAQVLQGRDTRSPVLAALARETLWTRRHAAQSRQELPAVSFDHLVSAGEE